MRQSAVGFVNVSVGEAGKDGEEKVKEVHLVTSKKDVKKDVKASAKMILGGKKKPVIKIMLGATLNMGNYQSARVDVGIDYPCSSDESIDEDYEKAMEWVEGRLTAQIGELKQSLISEEEK